MGAVQQILLAEPAAYSAKGITLNGTNNTYARGAAMTGIAATAFGTLSFWYTVEGGNGSSRQLVDNNGDRFQVYLDPSNKWHMLGISTGAVTSIDQASVPSYSASAGVWRWFGACWQLGSSPTLTMFDAAGAVSVTSNNLLANSDVNYANGANWWTGSNNAVANFFNGSVFDFWFDTTFLDLSVAGNRAKFVTVGGKPVNLGAAGQTPTGSSPLLYQHVGSTGVAADFATNLGTGGGMTAAGTTIALSATSPTT